MCVCVCVRGRVWWLCLYVLGCMGVYGGGGGGGGVCVCV